LREFDVNEVHELAVDSPPEAALERMLATPAGSNRVVRRP